MPCFTSCERKTGRCERCEGFVQESRHIGSLKLGCNVCHPRGSKTAGGVHPQHRHSVHSTLTFTLSSLEGGREGRTRRRSPRRHACDRSLAAERSRTVCEASCSLVAIPKHLHKCACDHERTLSFVAGTRRLGSGHAHRRGGRGTCCRLCDTCCLE